MSVVAFTTVGNHQWVVPAGVIAVKVLVVAGGGGGGGYAYAGGGGAGGVIYESFRFVSGTINITVGAAGLGGSRSLAGGDGGNSSFDNLTSIGGGGGGSENSAVRLGRNGGCGGGGSMYAHHSSGILVNGGIGSQGFNGGDGRSLSNYPGGGGGGMGSIGVNGAANKGGNGGAGVYYGDVFGTTYGASGWFAGGGGGGIQSGGAVGLGQAGGGNGAIWSALAQAAQVNTGSGGGGGTNDTSTRQNNIGGSGVVLILAYTDEMLNAQLTTIFHDHQTIKFSGGNIVLDNSLTGYAILQPTSLSKYITTSNIQWTQNTPAGTTINVYTGISNDSETLPDVWVLQTSGTPINSVPTYENLGGKYLWVKYELESDDLSYSPDFSLSSTITLTYGTATNPILKSLNTGWRTIDGYDTLPASILKSISTGWRTLDAYDTLPASILKSISTGWRTLDAYGTIPASIFKSLNTSWRIFESYAISAFKADRLDITLGDTIQFTDLSLNTPTNWLWDFGDTTTTTTQNPTHKYTTPGIYTITLTTENIYGGTTKVKEGYILVEAGVISGNALFHFGGL